MYFPLEVGEFAGGKIFLRLLGDVFSSGTFPRREDMTLSSLSSSFALKALGRLRIDLKLSHAGQPLNSWELHILL